VTVVGLIFNCLASSRIEGSFSPALKAPLTIIHLICAN